MSAPLPRSSRPVARLARAGEPPTRTLDVLRDVLDSLGHGVTADELTRRRNALRETFRASGESAEFDELWDRAMELRDERDQRERREQAIGALVDTAQDLSRLRDHDATLTAIVHRGRQLLSADAANLMLLDHEAGVLRMRVTDGIASREFASLEIAVGMGVSGAVAADGAPRWSADYPRDDRFRHDDVVDAANTIEGLHAVLGAPLITDGRVVGVLIAAHRRPRQFTPQEVDLYASLAAHASVALENARMFRDSQRTVAELHEATQALESARSDQDRAAVAHERLLQVAVSSEGMGEVVDSIGPIFGGLAAVTDADGRLLYGSGVDAALDEVTTEVFAELEAKRGRPAEAGARSWTPSSIRHHGHWWAASPLWQGRSITGALLIRTERQCGPAELRELERAALVASLVLAGARAAADVDREDRSELLSELLATRDPEQSRLIESALGLPAIEDLHLAVSTPADPAALSRLLRAGQSLGGELGGVCAEHDGRVVLMVPRRAGLGSEYISQRLSRAVAGGVTTGATGVTFAPMALQSAYDRADQCRRTLIGLGRAGSAADVSELMPYAVLVGSLASSDISGFLESTLQVLEEYDLRHNASLLQTLEVVYDCQNNVSEAAARLHLHPNTVYQRLARVVMLTDRDWKDPESAMQWQLALRLKRLIAA